MKSETIMSRIIIIGANGFLGSSVIKELENTGTKIIKISRGEIDLLAPSSAKLLKDVINEGDSVFFFSAIAPCKNSDQFIKNSTMAEIFCSGIGQKKLEKFVYVSSDSVYGDSNLPITENSLLEPKSLHGKMHMTREAFFEQEIISNCKVFLRPTLIYGYNDPHNGYGPNLFVRQSIRNNTLSLFGMGEEMRDHLSITDFAHIFNKVIKSNFSGYLNICTGSAITFLQIAQTIMAFNGKLKINFIERTMPIPHNGYRTFNNHLLKSLIGDYRFQNIESYLEKNYEKYK
jgi:nucleoside-diphosphate-sugar epimerase